MGKVLSQDKIELIKDNYPIYGQAGCCKNIGVSITAVQKYAKKFNLKLSAELKYKLNTNIKSLDLYPHLTKNFTKNSAYILGLIGSDGSVQKHSISIKIIEEDGNELEKIINYNNDFHVYRYCRKNRKPVIEFKLDSMNLCRFFKDLGKYSHSSENYSKILEIIPKELHCYFYRGLIDGDGCFNRKGYKSYFSICSNYNQDGMNVENLLNNLNIHYNIQRIKSIHGNLSRITFSNKNSLKILCKYLYSNQDGIYLNRKFNIIKDLLNDT